MKPYIPCTVHIDGTNNWHKFASKGEARRFAKHLSNILDGNVTVYDIFGNIMAHYECGHNVKVTDDITEFIHKSNDYMDVTELFYGRK